jgi:agmatinase
MKKIDELALYLRPPAQGVYSVSTGREEILSFAKSYLGEDMSDWKKQIKKIKYHNVAILAIPSDTGAGILRGASRGPEGIRRALGKAPCLDLGDIITIPHLLCDEMLSSKQIKQSREFLYPNISEKLPVSPMSILERVVFLIKSINPHMKIHLLGGDHTCSWFFFKQIYQGEKDLGILHFDAHTDLMPHRMGVDYCFSTWAYHANNLIGRGNKMLQVGIRASGMTQKFAEKEFQVKQIWANEVRKISPKELAEKVIDHFDELGIKKLYISNDLDGTDSLWASACGTPESNGLTPLDILITLECIRNSDIEVVGADLVELAPDLEKSVDCKDLSCDTACRYVKAQLDLLY